jgi:hypothetical protein
MRFSLRWVLGGIASLSLASTVVVAQGVLDRPRPEYDPIGLPAGGFRIYPNVFLGIAHDDNVFRTQVGEQSDTIFELAPDILIASNWTQHALNLRGGLQQLEFTEHDSESRTNFNVGTDGRLDILRGVTLSGALGYTVTHEPRTSPDLPGFAASPTRYGITHAQAIFRYQPVAFGFETGILYDSYAYNNTKLFPAGTLNNHDRDHDQTQVYARADYEFSPGYTAFLRGTYDTRSFDVKTDRSGVNRDSDGYRADVGMSLLVTRLIRGQVYGGYLEQNYHAPLTDVSGFNYGASLDWFPTELVTVHLVASRNLVDTSVIGASTRDDRQVTLSFDYELLRNVIIQGGIGYTNSVYQGTARDDDYIDANLTANYYITRYMAATARYLYSERDSTIPGQDFTDNLISAGLRLRL